MGPGNMVHTPAARECGEMGDSMRRPTPIMRRDGIELQLQPEASEPMHPEGHCKPNATGTMLHKG